MFRKNGIPQAHGCAGAVKHTPGAQAESAPKSSWGQHPTFMSIPVSCPIFPREDSGSEHGPLKWQDSSGTGPVISGQFIFASPRVYSDSSIDSCRVDFLPFCINHQSLA